MRAYTVCKIAFMQVAVSAILIRCLYSGATVAASHLERPFPGLIPAIADAIEVSGQLLVAHGSNPVGVGSGLAHTISSPAYVGMPYRDL